MELNRETLRQYKQRFDALTMSSQRKWGTLMPDGMLVHLRGVAELSLEERTAPDISNFFMRSIGRWLVFYVLPWPKGKIKVPPEWTPAPEGTLDEERARLFATMERFVERSAQEPNRIVLHPMFGQCTLKFWQRMHGVHFNHHLRQFSL
jgi:hypothetical protein